MDILVICDENRQLKQDNQDNKNKLKTRSTLKKSRAVEFFARAEKFLFLSSICVVFAEKQQKDAVFSGVRPMSEHRSIFRNIYIS